MYILKPGIKQDPAKRWALRDRIFFGNGACHILAGVFLDIAPLSGFHGEWLRPRDGARGNHFYVTNGRLAFDFHGYSLRVRLLEHYRRNWSARFPGWEADTVRVDFDLLDTPSLNRINHQGPDQYFGDPIARAARFIARIDHAAVSQMAEHRAQEA
jgi:hypothetical protein